MARASHPLINPQRNLPMLLVMHKTTWIGRVTSYSLNQWANNKSIQFLAIFNHESIYPVISMSPIENYNLWERFWFLTTNTFDFSMQNGLYMSRLQLQPWTANVLMLQRYNTYFLELILLKFQSFYFALATLGFNKNVCFFFWANAIIMYLMVALGHSYGFVFFFLYIFLCMLYTHKWC
jgi:hypothetical protein